MKNKKLKPSLSNTKNPEHIEILKVTPKNQEQAELIDVIERCEFVFVSGRAGSGKTYVALKMAMKMFMEKRFRRVILIRPAVTAQENLGYLPGDLDEKLAPYHQAIYDILDGHFGKMAVDEMIEEGRISIEAIAFLRGRSFDNCCIVVDEAQNTSSEQMKLILSRIGTDSKIIVCGDIKQSDLKTAKNGLSEAIQLLCGDGHPSFAHISLNESVRNPLIDYILDKYEKK